jgi:uncharacterized membrane protein
MLEILPFLASIYLELISPLSSSRMKRILKATAKAEGLNDNVAGKIETYAGYSNDASQIVSAFFLTIVGAIVLPVFRANIPLGIPIVVSLVAAMLALLYYVEVMDPYKWATKVVTIKKVQYSWASLIGIGLNVLLIVLVLVGPAPRIDPR